MNSFENPMEAGSQPEGSESLNNQFHTAPQAAQSVPADNSQNMAGSQNPAAFQAPYQSQQAPGRQDSPYASSPYANSPYMNYNQPPHQDTWGNPVPPQKPKKVKKPSDGKWGKRVLASVVAVALVAAGSGITALCLNNHWNTTLADMQQENESQIRQLEEQIKKASQSAVSSISPAGPDGALTPSQVYAKNVSSVVAISSTMGQNALGQVAKGSGSGFLLSADGYVATNCHVVQDAVSVSVITADNKEYPAKVLGKDPTNDVAVLKIDAEGLPAVTIGSSNDVLIGDMVVAIGNPLGELTATQTVGYIGGKDRTISTGGAAINMLQTDAAINAGNSGGPLFNMKGEVIGITTAKYSGTTGSGASIEGIGFAVPIDDVKGIMKDLADFGYVTGPYLGVSVRDVDPQIASVYNIPLGAYIVEVVPDASASRAGIQPKDIITRLGNYPIENSNDLIRALRHFKPGDTVLVEYNRAGASASVQMELDEKPQQNTVPAENKQVPENLPIPENGDYEDWYEFFDKFFGDFFGDARP